MVRLAVALRERDHEVRLVCPPPASELNRSVGGEAAKEGLPPAYELSADGGRGGFRLGDGAEVARLRRFLADEAIDLVHTWHTRDHVLALRAASRTDVRVVRSWRKAERIPAWPWNRWLYGPRTAGLLCVSPGTAACNLALRLGAPIRGVFGAVDLERFRPAPSELRVREELGLAASDRVVGIVARVQEHRRFDLLLQAAERLFARDDAARLLLVGRGTRRAELAEEPARRLGIADRVCFAGYRNEDYAAVLRAMDVFTFLVPGSDGTCRALLEAQACGLPAVTTRRGALPEIVVDGETGRVVDETPEALAGAWGALLEEPEARARLGAAARRRSEEHFSPEHLAEQVLALYGEAMA
jgi:glycosyltransferase involved in cell wall biosynthesis